MSGGFLAGFLNHQQNLSLSLLCAVYIYDIASHLSLTLGTIRIQPDIFCAAKTMTRPVRGILTLVVAQ